MYVKIMAKHAPLFGDIDLSHSCVKKQDLATVDRFGFLICRLFVSEQINGCC